MDRRTLLKLGALSAGSATLAGCLDSLPGVNGDAKASPLEQNRVDPTGNVQAYDLYLNTGTQEVSPTISVPSWGFSDSGTGPFTFPGPTLRATAGDEVRVNFHNLMDMPHTIHWHGVHLPWDMDGVPYISQDPIPGGESFEYVFPARPGGTHWYHCHVDAPHHIDMGMYGALVFEDPTDPWRVGGPMGVTQDKVLVLDELDRTHIHSAGAYLEASGTPGVSPTGNPLDTAHQAESQANDLLNRPPNPTEENSAASTNPAQEDRSWYPTTYPAYEPDWNTYMINGKAFPMTEPLRLVEGEATRLRFVHAGNLRHSLHIHGHAFLVTHTDGQPLPDPYWKDTLEIAPGERYDCILFGDNPGVWAMHEHSGHASNHETYPGGIFTVLAYDGFDLPFEAQESGDFIRWYQDR